MDSRYIPAITSIITSGNIGGLTATTINPIVIGTHNVDTTKYNSYITILGMQGECGNSARLDSTGIWSAQLGGRQGNMSQLTQQGTFEGLSARLIYTRDLTPPPPRRRPFQYGPKFPVNGNECPINYRYISFGDTSMPPNFNYILTQVSNYSSRLQTANNLLSTNRISNQEFVIFWSMASATSLICELSNPNETIIIVNNEKGWPANANLPYGMGGFREYNNGFFRSAITIKPNNNSTGVPWQGNNRNRNLYIVNRPITLGATGPGGTIAKTLSYKSIINKYPMSW